MPESLQHGDQSDAGSRRASAALGALAVAYALFDAATAMIVIIMESDEFIEELASFLFGGCFIQAMLLGFWVAVGPGAVFIRGPLAIATAMSAVYAVAYTVWWQVHRFAAAEFFAVVASVGLVLLGVTALFGAGVRWWSRQTVQRSLAGAAPRRFQFSIRDMLGLTTLCAILLGLGSPFLGSASDVFSTGDVLPGMAAATAVILALGVPTLVVPWAILSPLPREPLLALGGIFWVIWTLVAIAVMAATVPFFDLDLVPFFFVGQLGAFAMGAFSAAVLFAVGYRLVSSAKESLSPAGETSSSPPAP
jgi:hypothetical protein